MPFGVLDSSGVVTDYAAGRATTAKVWLLADNLLIHAATPMLPTVAVGLNPSSQDKLRPMTNVISPAARDVGAFGNRYVLGANTDLGYSHCSVAGGGNYNLRIGATDIDMRSATPTDFVYGGAALAYRMQTKIRASAAPGAANYSVSFSTATGKFTIAHTTTNFTLVLKATDPNSILDTIGFNAGSYTGAKTYTSNTSSVMSDDAVVFDLGDLAILGTNGATLCNRWRWFYLINCNYAGLAAAGSVQKLVLYTATSLADLNQKPDSFYTEGDDKFILNAAYLGVSEGRSQSAQIGRQAATASLFRIFDVAAARNAAGVDTAHQGAVSDRYARLKVVDPNRGGETALHIGYAGFSTGFWPTHSVPHGYSFDAVDRSSLVGTDEGARLPRFDRPGRAMTLSFGRGNPLSNADAEILRSFLESAVSDAYSTDWINGNSRPIVLINEHTALDSADSGLYARGAIFGYLSRGKLVHYADDQWHGEFEFIGDV